MDKVSGSSIFPDPDPAPSDPKRPDQDPGDPIRPDPTQSGSGSTTLLLTILLSP